MATPDLYDRQLGGGGSLVAQGGVIALPRPNSGLGIVIRAWLRIHR